jgi:sister chromatid cohesion protein DCC1
MVLRESAWGGLGSDLEKKSKKRKRGDVRKWTRAQLDSVVQASEGELERGLRERNVVEIDGMSLLAFKLMTGRMLLLPVKKLVPLLNLTLTLLTIHSSTTKGITSSSVEPMINGLAEHDLPKDLGRAVLELFGRVEEDVWEADITRMVTEVGKGLLEELRGENQESDVFMYKWRDIVGEQWSEICNFKLLEVSHSLVERQSADRQGEHLLTSPEGTAKLTSTSPTITPFPLHTLPLQPAIRFADLFLTRARWRPEEMTPFLKGLYRDGDNKERDKLITKFVRVVKEKEGSWWYPRRTA